MDTNQPPKTSFYSITWKGLEKLLVELGIPQLDIRKFALPPFDTHDLARILRSRRIYPARDFSHLIEKRMPDIFITYHWRENILAVRASILNTLRYCLLSAEGLEPSVDQEDVLRDGVTFWLDWIFLDQNSRNVSMELNSVMPILFRECTVHAVVSSTALSRAWCCYELAQFNRKAAENRDLELTSLIPEDIEPYPLWESVVTTDPNDKMKIEQRIQEGFPDGLTGVEYLMVQAGLVADIGGQIGATAERIKRASQSWVKRFNSQGS